MSSENVLFMTSMGFGEDLSKSALDRHGGNLEAAINWALENKNKFSISKDNNSSNEGKCETVESPSGVSHVEPPAEQAKSLKCEDCGKLFKSIEAAELHGLKTQHENFAESTEEIKPLTVEEKKQQSERVQQLIAERRLKRQKEEADSERQNEISRREAAKQISQIKEEMREKEIKKMQEERKREKEEDRLAKQRILEQIAKDKEERRLRMEKEKQGIKNDNLIPEAPVMQAVKPVVSNAAQARIQVRLSTGSQFNQVFKSSETLAAVRCLIMIKEPTFSSSPETIQLICPMLAKTFNEDDMEKTLGELGLSPSAVLIAKI